MRAFQKLPIKRQLMLLIMLTSGVVVLLACAAFVAYDQVIVRRNMKRDLAMLAEVLGGINGGPLMFGRPDNAVTNLATLKDVPHILSACIYDATGKQFATYQNRSVKERTEPPPKPSAEGPPYFDQGRLNVFQPIRSLDGERLGTIFLQSSLTEVFTRLQLFTGAVAVIMLVAFAVVFLLSSQFQGIISKPILDLAQTARAVSEQKDYSLRVRSQTAGEIGFLIDQFNGMLGKIEASEKEMSEVNKQLVGSEQRATAATQAKSQFLANMSHELRTLLNAIIGFSEMLHDKTFGDLNERQIKYVTNILTSGRHLLQLINDILDLAKVEAGRLELDRTSFDVATSLEDVQTIVKTLANRKGITLAVEAEPGLPPLFADQPKFKQVMYNLLSNAIKFTPDGGHVTVRAGLSAWERERKGLGGQESSRVGEQGGAGVAALKSGKCLRISVADTGIGIKAGDQARVFLEFEQADSSYARQQHGTGLGLSLTRKLVELHGGRIWVESEGLEGQGSNFIFLLPIDTEEAPRTSTEELTKAEARRAEAAAKREATASRPLVLIVEDERPAAELLEAYLTSEGYAVAHAWDGEQALQLALQLRPYAITLDILLPKKSGWEVLAELKAMPATKDIPIIIVSISDDLQFGFSLGAIEYFVKPVSKDRLLEAVNRARDAVGKEVQTVLVIDDERMTVEFLTSTIQGAGFNVIPAYSGKAGVELAIEHRPDLIILDLIMPEVSGFEVVQQLRARPDTRETPILIYTAKDLTEPERKALIQHVQAIAPKSGKEDLHRELKRLARLNQERRRVT